MRFSLFTLIIPFIILGAPLAARAQVISEVMWMGTELSSSDEWLEVSNPTHTVIDLTDWSLLSLQSSGQDAVALKFPAGTLLQPGQAIVIAHFAAANSRLDAEPAFVVSSLTLPNTKLLLKLVDASGAVRDSVDDGVGNPFAGANPSGGAGRASMERVDLFAAGTVKENWVTAATSSGFDPESTSLGTPGVLMTLEVESSSSSASSETPSQSSSSEPPFIASIPPSELPTCRDTTEVGIFVQSGELSGVGKTSVNFQAVALSGSLTGITCSWQFTDGFSSTSCNPPSHSFTTIGETIVSLEAINKCGNTLSQSLLITIFPDPSSTSSTNTNSVVYDGSKIILTQALPNPESTDTGKEWIELKNMEKKGVNLDGWKIGVGTSSVSWYSLKGTIGAEEKIRLFNSEIKFSLPNSKSKMQLVTPAGQTLSTIIWESTDEGRTYFTDDIRELSIEGKVLRVTGGLTFDIEASPQIYAITGQEILHVRLLGLKETGLITISEQYKEKIGSYEILSALLKDQKVELEFDSIIWDSEGKIQAYAFLEGGRFLQAELLLKPYWDLDTSLLLTRESQLKEIVGINKVPKTNSDLTNNENREQNSRSNMKLEISEVYPAPYPKSQSGSHPEWQMVEWIELFNPNQSAIDVNGYSLIVNEKKKQLPSATKIASGSWLVLRMSDLKISLKNDGATVSVIAPDGEVISTTEYPKLKAGQSYAKFEQKFCTTQTVTPGEFNKCVLTVVHKDAARKIATAQKAAQKIRVNAASYSKQVQSEEAEPELDFAFPDTEESSSSFGLLISIFALGIGLPVIVGIFIFRKGLIRLTPENSPLASEPALLG